MFESKEDEIDSFVERHNESSHAWLCNGYGLAVSDLIDPKRYNGAPATHNVAVSCAADLGCGGLTALGYGDFLLNSFGYAHRVDGIGGFVSAKANDGFHFGFDGCGEDVVGADNVGVDRLHREELTGRHLLEGGSVEDVVYVAHSSAAGVKVTDVTNVEFDLVGNVWVFRLVLMAHVVLFFFVAREDADFSYIGTEEAAQDCISEGSCTS